MTGDAEHKPVVRRPVVSDMDGTREGGLVFCIVLLFGLIGAAVVVPGALTSFWVWFAVLSMAVGIAVNVKALVARLFGHQGDWDTDA